MSIGTHRQSGRITVQRSDTGFQHRTIKPGYLYPEVESPSQTAIS
ncbi:hypothetical protein [Pseudoduganella violacea]|uniref:Uncharacterized protein n=1 Tax=Pseudoduganella violacea TaxID=1715466 RepID=A0A7W5BE76_9BURK|nr:hypothetical protein [Pseudoduganella violacea]MBB3121587.1 hypothetical protein [Pseudoduganella violacea]